jgi:hypothetical protein
MFKASVPKPASSVPLSHRVIAIAEVIGTFTFVHISFRAIKHFTDVGRLDVASRLNFTPGLVIILFTVGLVLIRGGNFSAYGLTAARWTDGLRLGLLGGLILIGGAALLASFGLRHQAGGPPPSMQEGIAYGLACLAAVGSSRGWSDGNRRF